MHRKKCFNFFRSPIENRNRDSISSRIARNIGSHGSEADDAEFSAKLPEFVDLDNLARYMAITTWLCDLDGILGPGQNYYLWLHPRTQKFTFIPWDQDQTFGQFPRGSTEEQRENLSIQKPWSGENRFLERLFKTESFKKAFLVRLQEFNGTIFEPAAIRRQVDELANVLRPAIQAESPERLTELNKAAAGERVTIYMGPVGMGGTLVKPIKSFVEARAQSVSDQLAGKSQGQTVNSGFGPPGGRRFPGQGRFPQAGSPPPQGQRPAQEPPTR